jgi:hypothetical protein
MPESPTASASGAVQAGHQFVIDAAGEDFQHGVERFRRGDAQPPTKRLSMPRSAR